eukprot:4079183-Pleurochrysis_carterae.AAC.1
MSYMLARFQLLVLNLFLIARLCGFSKPVLTQPSNPGELRGLSDSLHPARAIPPDCTRDDAILTHPNVFLIELSGRSRGGAQDGADQDGRALPLRAPRK